VRGEDDDAVLAQFAEQVEEPHAFGGIESGRRLVDNHQPGIAEQRDGHAESLAHPAGVAAKLVLAHVVEVGLLQQRVHDLFARAPVGDALEDGEMVEQTVRGDVGVDAELLWQVAEGLAHFVLLPHHVDRVSGVRRIDEADRSGVGFLQRRDRSHQGRFAGAVRAEEAEHAGMNRQRDILERGDTVGVGFREISNL